MPTMFQSLKQIPSWITGMGGLKSSLVCKWNPFFGVIAPS
jgi:hypothetical protein